MHGIDKKPFIDCQQYVDVDGIKQLEKEICYGLAKSQWQAGVYGPGILDEEFRKSFISLSFKYQKTQLSGDEQREFLSLNRNQQSKFFKLYEKMYSASHVIYIRDFKDKSIKSYEDKAKTDSTFLTDDSKYFPNLLKWIEKLPFEEIGRIIFFIHEHDCELLIHRDGVNYKPHKNEFLWINPTIDKEFFIWDEITQTKHVVTSPVAFFNDMDMHGGGRPKYMTWSLRVDGKFTSEFKKLIGIDHLDQY
jgi:hypothetical protein